MLKSCLRVLIFIVSVTAIAAYSPAEAKSAKFPLASFDNTNCYLKGRSQDCPSKVMAEILKKGKDSIPILISQLTDSERTKKPVEAQWSYTTSGDVAYIVLVSLFTNPDGTFNLPDVPTWKAVLKGCNAAVEGCWRDYIQKNGRKSVQEAWLSAWKLHQDKIFWDPQEKCFRVTGVPSGRPNNPKN
jgi:hypothetical protein